MFFIFSFLFCKEMSFFYETWSSLSGSVFKESQTTTEQFIFVLFFLLFKLRVSSSVREKRTKRSTDAKKISRWKLASYTLCYSDNWDYKPVCWYFCNGRMVVQDGSLINWIAVSKVGHELNHLYFHWKCVISPLKLNIHKEMFKIRGFHSQISEISQKKENRIILSLKSKIFLQKSELASSSHSLASHVWAFTCSSWLNIKQNTLSEYLLTHLVWAFTHRLWALSKYLVVNCGWAFTSTSCLSIC